MPTEVGKDIRMKNKIYDLMKMDIDEKSDGQGFVLVGESKSDEPQNEEKTTAEGESKVNTEPTTEKANTYGETPNTFNEQTKKTPPITEKMTDSDEKFFSQFNNNTSTSANSGNVNNSSTGNNSGFGNNPSIGNQSGFNSGTANNPNMGAQNSNDTGYSGGGNYNQPPGGKPEVTSDQPNKGNKKTSRNILIIVLALILGLGGGLGGGYLAVNNFSGSGGSSNGGVTINPSSETEVTEAVAAKVLPSVVGITATTTQVSQNMIFGPQEQEVSGVGTGIIIDESGYILTNSHVIMDDDKSQLNVLLSSGDEVKGTVEWFDATLDLAIVKIEAKGLTAADLGDSDDIKIGQYAAAIGNPLGLEFQGSVTAGVVSGLGRSITAASDNKEVTMEDLIQVDAAINSGNSGGPLLNNEGQVIGINTAKAESGEGMGFAIPINTAKPIVDEIIETGEFNRVYMGVSVRDASDIIDEYPNVDLGTETGAYIVQTTAGSPAEKAGLKEKDIIVDVDGKEIENRTDLINLLLNYKAGDTLKVKYYRDGKAATANVTLTGDEPQV